MIVFGVCAGQLILSLERFDKKSGVWASRGSSEWINIPLALIKSL